MKKEFMRDEACPIPLNTNPFEGVFLSFIIFERPPVHVFPVDDKRSHDVEHFFECNCHPKVELANATFIVTHNLYK